jgi:hypothetical protein
MRWLVFLAVCCGGCGSSVEYQGWSPSFRYTRDDPGLNDIYYGIDANFVIAEPTPRRTNTVAQAQAVDPWNTPVAYQPLTAPVLNPIQEAGVNADPAIDNK